MASSHPGLSIAGTQTFAAPVALDIPSGLTGFVGPDGCGRGNVVDALRWVIGEGDGRTLRGAEMEDVVFAGTAARPSLEEAEVALTMGESGFPARFAGLTVMHMPWRHGAN